MYTERVTVETPAKTTTSYLLLALSWRTSPMRLNRNGFRASRRRLTRTTWFRSHDHSPYANDRLSLPSEDTHYLRRVSKGLRVFQRIKKMTGAPTGSLSALNHYILCLILDQSTTSATNAQNGLLL